MRNPTRPLWLLLGVALVGCVALLAAGCGANTSCPSIAGADPRRWPRG